MQIERLLPLEKRADAVTAAYHEFKGMLFGLRAFRDSTFRVHDTRFTHFYSELEGVQLVIEICRDGTDTWEQFGRFHPDDIRKEQTWRRFL